MARRAAFGLALLAAGMAVFAAVVLGASDAGASGTAVAGIGLAILLVAAGSFFRLTSPDGSRGGRVVLLLAGVVATATLGAAYATLHLVTDGFRQRAGAPASTVDWVRAPATDLAVAAVFGVAAERGTAAALDRLEALAAEDATIRARGHAIAHALGRFSIQNADYDPRVFGECREIFQSGCYHGVLEAFFEARPADAATVRSLCDAMTTADAPPILARECAHGLGHGLTAALAYDLPGALDLCGALDREVEREECYDGVFMENAVNGTQPADAPLHGGMHGGAEAGSGDAHGGHPDAHAGADAPAPAGDPGYRGAVKRDDHAFPCDAVDPDYRRACWSYQNVVVAHLTDGDEAAAFAACRAAGEPYRDACVQGLGKQVWGSAPDDPGRTVDACREGAPERLAACLRGAVEGSVDTDWSGGGALAFCGAVPEPERPACFRYAGARLALVTAGGLPEVEAACAAAGEHADTCRAGAAAQIAEIAAR